MPPLQEEAAALGKSSFAFAFYMDRQKEERERGVTISCTTKEFFTDNFHYTIIDAPGEWLERRGARAGCPGPAVGPAASQSPAHRRRRRLPPALLPCCPPALCADLLPLPPHPTCLPAGHRDFIKNMISGAAQADVCLLMVPADGNFTTAIQKGDHKAGEIQGQTRQHARLLNLLGVRQLIVGINKMDADTAGYKQVGVCWVWGLRAGKLKAGSVSGCVWGLQGSCWSSLLAGSSGWLAAKPRPMLPCFPLLPFSPLPSPPPPLPAGALQRDCL